MLNWASSRKDISDFLISDFFVSRFGFLVFDWYIPKTRNPKRETETFVNQKSEIEVRVSPKYYSTNYSKSG